MKGLETIRLTSRLLALALLVVIAAFTNLVSPVGKADDENKCIEACDREYILCCQRHACDRTMQCSNEQIACENKCRGLFE